jgi:hypothetical protein
MQNRRLNLKRIHQLQSQLLNIIEDSLSEKITPEEADMRSAPLHKELDEA